MVDLVAERDEILDAWSQMRATLSMQRGLDKTSLSVHQIVFIGAVVHVWPVIVDLGTGKISVSKLRRGCPSSVKHVHPCDYTL